MSWEECWVILVTVKLRHAPWNMQWFAGSWLVEYWALALGWTAETVCFEWKEKNSSSAALFYSSLALTNAFCLSEVKFSPSFTEFSLLAAEFWPWELHKSMPTPFASLAALHTRLLSYHPDACFLFLLSLPYLITLHISFPESNHRPACQIPANWEPGVVTFWQNFKGFFPYFSLPFNYKTTCVAVRILLNLAQEYWSSA